MELIAQVATFPKLSGRALVLGHLAGPDGIEPPIGSLTGSCLTAWLRANRFFAIFTYSFSFSIPMNLKPRFFAATPVEPEPQNGSRTVPPDGVMSLQRYSMSFEGFTQGCPLVIPSSPAFL